MNNADKLPKFCWRLCELHRHLLRRVFCCRPSGARGHWHGSCNSLSFLSSSVLSSCWIMGPQLSPLVAISLQLGIVSWGVFAAADSWTDFVRVARHYFCTLAFECSPLPQIESLRWSIYFLLLPKTESWFHFLSMVDFNSPRVLLQDFLAVAKIWSTVDGLYIWEFVTTLDFEWSFIRGRRTHNWTIWIYATTRVATLIVVIFNLLSISITAQYNCNAALILQLFFGYLAVASASLLIVLRILAIWNKKRIVLWLSSGVWATNVIFTIQSIARTRATWSTLENICAETDLNLLKQNILVTLTTDIILLVTMLVGLLSKHLYERSTYGLGRLLWKQGLIWFFIATVAEALPAIFFCMNLNNAFNYMFMTPSVISLTIAATRIHRSLTEFAATACNNLSPHIFDSGHTSSVSHRPRAAPIPLSHMEVAVHKTFEMDQMNHHVSFIDTEGQLRNKSAVPGPDVEIENSAETHSQDLAEMSRIV